MLIVKFLIESSLLHNIYHVYHGSKASFDKFNQEFIGKNAIEYGFGIYFTNRKYIAQSYGDYLYEADIVINNPFSNESITVTKNQIKEFISHFIDPDAESGYLSDWGDINNQSYESILNKAVDSIYLCSNSDVDIISELLYNLPNKTDDVFDAFIAIFHKDGIISPGYSEFDGKPVITYIIFSNNQIKNLKKTYIK